LTWIPLGFAGETTVELAAVSRGEFMPLLVDAVNLADNRFSLPLSFRLKMLIGRFKGTFFIVIDGDDRVLLMEPQAEDVWGICTVGGYIGCSCAYGVL
jgi:hypothetical protein